LRTDVEGSWNLEWGDIEVEKETEQSIKADPMDWTPPSWERWAKSELLTPKAVASSVRVSSVTDKTDE